MPRPREEFTTREMVLAFRALYRWPTRQIATELGISTQAVNKHLTRAREETWATYQGYLKKVKDPSVR